VVAESRFLAGAPVPGSSNPGAADVLRQRVPEVQRGGQTVFGPIPCSFASWPESSSTQQKGRKILARLIPLAGLSDNRGSPGATIGDSLQSMMPAAERQGEESSTLPLARTTPSWMCSGVVLCCRHQIGGVRPREAVSGHGSGRRERGSSSQGNRESEKTLESGR